MRNFKFRCGVLLMRDIGLLKPKRDQRMLVEPRSAQLQTSVALATESSVFVWSRAPVELVSYTTF